MKTQSFSCRRTGIITLATAIFASACVKPAPPAPTVGLAQAARTGVILRRGAETIALLGDRRIEDGAEIVTPPGGRASLLLDGGSWALLDEKTTVRVGLGRVDLVSGRLWVDARDVDAITVAIPGGTLSAAQAGFAVSSDDKGAQAYCVAGQLTYAAKTGNRLEAGMSVRVTKSGEVKEEPESQWDDWTGGLAEPGPARPAEPAGIGQLSARSSAELGQARSPLIIRRHEVRTVIRRDLAITDVEQAFFNPRSQRVDGVYDLRLPRGAIIAGFEVRGEEDPTIFGSQELGAFIGKIVPAVRNGPPSAGVSLQWVGPDRYRAAVADLAPGKTRVVRVRYVEWLGHHDGRRTWVYAMGGRSPPLLGEFSLEADTGSAGAVALEAGMGARNEGGRVVLRKSDFRPHADFALDLIDDPKASKETPAYRTRLDDGLAQGYVLVPIAPPPMAAAASLDLVLVADVSAATDPGRLDLEKATVDAILRQLRPGDRVALLAGSTGARALGAGEALAAASAARAEELLEALSHEAPAGATDLSAMLEQAAALVSSGNGAVVYIGDGQPTVGALLPGELGERLARQGHRPRLYAVAVGPDARTDLLEAITDDAGLVLRVEDRPDAAHAAYRLLASAALPTLRDVRVDLGPSVDVAFPIGPLTLIAGQPIFVVGRLRGEAPRTAILTGRSGLDGVRTEIPLTTISSDEGGDLRRRWAMGRLHDLLERGAGPEAVTEVGTRFDLITPWSALVTSGEASFSPLDPTDLGGVFVPMSDRDQPPDDATIALEPGTTSLATVRGSLDAIYVRTIGDKSEGVRACYERKAAGHPELSGRVTLSVKVGLGGEVAAVRSLGSTLGDAQVEACINRAVMSMRLPPPPDHKVHEVVRAFQFVADDGRLGAANRCSAASRQYLATRRALWRERLSGSPGVEGAMAVWRRADLSCELRTWLDRRALLDLMRQHVGATADQVDLYHRFDDPADMGGTEQVRGHLRREILRAVRTQRDLLAVRGGLALDGGFDRELIEAQLKTAATPAARLAVIRQFITLAPDGIALRVRLLALLEVAAATAPEPQRALLLAEARRVAWALRSDPASDLSARQTVGEFFERRGEKAEAARALSEIVEFAPFDPWARRRLGDLYLAHALPEDAYREYNTLAWLTPTDHRVLLLLARAAAAAGRTDEALRLEERLAESVETGPKDPAAWARTAISLQLAALRDGARTAHDERLAVRLAARGRADGLLSWSGDLLVGLTWPHPDARMELSIIGPGDQVARRAEINGGDAGIEASRLRHQASGAYTVNVTRPVAQIAQMDAATTFEGELWLLWNEAEPNEAVVRLPIRFPVGSTTLSFIIDGHSAKLAKVPAAAPTPSSAGDLAKRPRRRR